MGQADIPQLACRQRSGEIITTYVVSSNGATLAAKEPGIL